MNKKVSIVSSYILAGVIAIFFICLGLSLIENKTIYSEISYGVCIILSWSYLVTVIGSNRLCKEDRYVVAEAGKLFAVIYSVFVSIVYFTQLTAVIHNLVPKDLNQLFNYQYIGSWMFRIDLIGYGIMALSTLFIGLSIEPKDKPDKVLKWLLLIHGIFVVTIILPITPMFSDNSGTSNTGMIALLFWCVMFLPIALLFARRFKNAKEL